MNHHSRISTAVVKWWVSWFVVIGRSHAQLRAGAGGDDSTPRPPCKAETARTSEFSAPNSALALGYSILAHVASIGTFQRMHTGSAKSSTALLYYNHSCLWCPPTHARYPRPQIRLHTNRQPCARHCSPQEVDLCREACSTQRNLRKDLGSANQYRVVKSRISGGEEK